MCSYIQGSSEYPFVLNPANLDILKNEYVIFKVTDLITSVMIDQTSMVCCTCELEPVHNWLSRVV